MSTYIKSLSKPIAVVGLGKSGEAARKLLLAHGLSNSDIITFDDRASADFNDGFKMLTEAQPKTLVVSPGVPLASPWIQFAKNQGCTITSEINLACSVLKSEQIIGVTGALGKSTTVATLGHAATIEDENAFVGGNLGTPFAQYAVDLAAGRKRARWIILELSSYQLENCDLLHCQFSAITYLTPNHMERYSSLDDYYSTKWSLIKRTTQAAFLNKFGGDLVNWSTQQKSPVPIMITDPNQDNLKEFDLHKARLIGSHNQQNIALAAQIAIAAGWSRTSICALTDFAGLEHRMENLGLINGVRFINDSKATAIDSVITAYKSAKESSQGDIYLLLGGKDKNLPWEDLRFLKQDVQCRPVLFGQCRETVFTKSHLSGPSFEHLEDAVKYCLQHSKSGDTVLLSPGGTSLDEFKSFEDRGNSFKRWIPKT